VPNWHGRKHCGLRYVLTYTIAENTAVTLKISAPTAKSAIAFAYSIVKEHPAKCFFSSTGGARLR
jgi:hypothetical protein